MSRFKEITKVHVYTIIAMGFVLLFTLFITVNACNPESDSVKEAFKSDDSTSLRQSTEELAMLTIPEPTSNVPEESMWEPDRLDVEYIAKTLYGECRGVKSETEKAAVVWCILNRVDNKGYACGQSIEHVITFENQFHGYSPENPIIPELESLTVDVLCRWHAEKMGQNDVGRILPCDYIYFVGDGEHNYFTREFLGKDYWDFSLTSPYES